MEYKIEFTLERYYKGTIEADSLEEVKIKFDNEEVENVVCRNSEIDQVEIKEL